MMSFGGEGNTRVPNLPLRAHDHARLEVRLPTTMEEGGWLGGVGGANIPSIRDTTGEFIPGLLFTEKLVV